MGSLKHSSTLVSMSKITKTCNLLFISGEEQDYNALPVNNFLHSNSSSESNILIGFKSTEDEHAINKTVDEDTLMIF